MLNFDESDLARYFHSAGLDVDVELGSTEEQIEGRQYLNQVGAPGRPTLLERWRTDFAAQDVERLASFLADRSIPTRVEHAYLTARKP